MLKDRELWKENLPWETIPRGNVLAVSLRRKSLKPLQGIRGLLRTWPPASQTLRLQALQSCTPHRCSGTLRTHLTGLLAAAVGQEGNLHISAARQLVPPGGTCAAESCTCAALATTLEAAKCLLAPLSISAPAFAGAGHHQET